MGRSVRDKISELRATCRGLRVPQILALRRMALADPETLRRAPAAELDAFFADILGVELRDFTYEALERIAARDYAPLLPPGPPALREEDRGLLRRLSHPLLGNHSG